MPTASPEEITQLLLAWSGGDEAALERLTPLVYEELRRLARSYSQGERGSHSLQTTALVHEAYVRLVDAQRVEWRDRAHFFGISARLMRQVLVDFARQRGARKRGGAARCVSLDEALLVGPERDEDLVALNEALDALAEVDPRKSQVVELRFFGGLTIPESAEVLGVSPETVRRDWRLAKAWLRRYLSEEERDGR